MYKVMLVDDEMFVRQGLRSLMDWESLGYSVAGEAENGEEALQLIRDIDPDLVITDIRMPVLDGLELIKRVSEETVHDPSFIIVSGYHDFKYAQQAIRYGVHDYVLKPIDEVELASTLRKLAKSLGSKRWARRGKDKSMPDSILEGLITGEIGAEEAGEYASALPCRADSRFVYVIAERSAKPPASESGEALYRKAAHALSGYMELGGDAPLQELQHGRFGFLLNPAPEIKTDGREGEQFWSSVRSALVRALETPVTLYAGQTVFHLTQVKMSHDAAQQALQHRFAEEGSAVIRWESVHSKPLHPYDVEQELVDKVLERVEENNKRGYEEALESIFRHFKSSRFTPSAVFSSLNRCVMAVLKVIRAMDGSEENAPVVRELQEAQSQPVTLKELKEMAGGFIAEAADRIAQLRKEQSKGGIEKIKKYIETHYTENISLKSIAAQFYMNPVYLGQLFRKTYGVYFNDFLLHLRVQEAKKLLRQTDMRMYEIAEKVGFQNADYFVTQFEKLEQVTPTEYRNKLLGRS
ncbi:response regulator transcription factor [Gorillibacterium sp. sgz5001074]|uniref:response regulator transcription factor n=1 Tax=Gorillibacterium sp. sgz5001074 TaxID=3446695 RepID=UPI003F6665F7